MQRFRALVFVSSFLAAMLGMTQVASAQVSTGCINAFVEASDGNGNIFNGPSVTIRLDAGSPTQTSGGQATFSNVSPGTHTVTQDLLQGWTNFSTVPFN